MVFISHLSHRYGQRLALDDLSLSIAPQECFGFLGPNGSGKTTLFRMLSTLLPAPAGKITIAGLDVTRQADAVRRQIGVVFQSPGLDKQLTAEENLRHQGHLYGLKGLALSRRIDELLTRMGVADRRGERVESLSGGLRRRVELAKGMLHHPTVLLLDEPSVGLDPAARLDLWRYLKELQQNDGITVLLTTHLMDEADRCDRVAILDGGQLKACDTPATLKDRIGGDVITLDGPDPRELARIILEKFQIATEIVEGKVRLQRRRGHEFIPQLVETLAGKVQAVSLGKPTLDDVFIESTGHGFEAAADEKPLAAG